MQPWRIGPWRLMRSSTCSVWGWCFFGCQRSWGFSLNLEKNLYNTLNGNPLQKLTFCAFFCSNPCRHLCGWRWWYTMLAICQQFLRPGCWKKQPCAVNGIIMEAVPAGVWSVWFFAGDGHVGRSAKFAYYSTAQLDINYGKMTVRKGKQNSFDMTTAAGLASLVKHWRTLKFSKYKKQTKLWDLMLTTLCYWGFAYGCS